MKVLLQSVIDAVGLLSAAAVSGLNPPATNEALAELQQAIPDTPYELYELLKLHNGENAISYSLLAFLPNGMHLMDIQGILRMYAFQQEIADDFIENVDELVAKNVMDRPFGPVKPVFSYSRRIPFAQFNHDVIWYVDLDPTFGGNIGQVVHEDAEGLELRVIASSLENLLTMYLRDLKAGVFIADENGQLLCEGAWPCPVGA